MVEVSDVVAVPSPAGAKKKRRFSLRLDDGTLIRSTPDGRVESLSPEEAYRRGFLSEEHLLHTQALLCEAHAKLPDEGPLRSISNMSKRSADTLLEGLNGGKKPRAVSLPPALGSPAPPPVASPPPAAPAPAPAPTPPTLRDPLVPKGNSLIDKVVTALGGPKDAAALGFTVAVDAKLVPDYYEIVKHPINLGEIRGRLKRGEYASPVEFYDQMRLLFDNCFLYNPAGTPVHRLGLHAEAVFDREWARTPWANLVPARPPPSPELLQPPGAQAPKRNAAARRSQGGAGGPRRASSAASGGAGAVARGAGAGGASGLGTPKAGGGGARRGSGVSRTKSVNSYRAGAPLPPDRQAALAAALQDEQVLAVKMEGVVGILQQAGELPTNEDGEVELDLGVLTPATVWALHDHVLGPLPDQGAHANGNGGGFQLADDSEYEPDFDDED